MITWLFLIKIYNFLELGYEHYLTQNTYASDMARDKIMSIYYSTVPRIDMLDHVVTWEVKLLFIYYSFNFSIVLKMELLDPSPALWCNRQIILVDNILAISQREHVNNV